jgi:hypothetical protein
MVPGTPAYRAPETWLFPLSFGREPVARCPAGPAQDLYALGVTGYRLVTGQYPELGEPRQDEAGTWQLEEVAPSALLKLNPRVTPPLIVLILRMLSVRPEARGTAGELAEALELAEAHPVQGSERPLFSRQRPLLSAGHGEAQESSGVRGSAGPVSLLVRGRPGRAWVAMAVASLSLAAWAWWALPSKSMEKPAIVRKEAASASQHEGGTTGLGDAASTASTVASPESAAQEALAGDTPPEPQPGQIRPDGQGRCPHKRQVALNGACWAPLKEEREECEAASGQMFKDRCYVPVMLPGRPPPFRPANTP